jgi:phosphate transport system permease protein
MLKSLSYASALVVFMTIFTLVLYVFAQGIPNLTLDIFSPIYTSENASMLPSIINTFCLTILSLLISVPLGVSAAIYLVEYADGSNWFVKLIRIAADTLSGIPSIIYGLFGMLLFVGIFDWGYSLLAGVFTLAIMVLPLILRTTEEVLMQIPNSMREGSLALGAGKLRTIVRIVLPSAVPGILAGIILAVGRIVGETAALIFTAGTVAKLPASLFDSTRTLAVHMYNLSSEGLHIGQAYATASVLLLLVVLLNAGATFVARKIEK